MLVVGLDHCTINTTDLAATVEYYARFLKMRAGWRPTLPIAGAWLYTETGSYPILHVIEVSELAPSRGRSAVDHLAFRCEGLAEHLRKLDDAGLSYDARPVPETDLVQVHQLDPNGITIELTFEGEELPEYVVPAPIR